MIEFAISKPRGLPGEANPFAKLSRAQVDEIKLLRRAGHTYKAIGLRFGVSLNTAWSICAGRNWSAEAQGVMRRADESDAPHISTLRAQGYGRRRIAQVLGCTESSVYAIFKGLDHAAH